MMKKLLILVVVIMIFITGCGNTSEEEDVMISVKEVNNIIEKYSVEDDVYIIDVREIAEYEEGHLSLAINVPLSKLNSIKDIEVIGKNSKIIVYCRSGSRSKEAQERLKNMGYNNAYDMGGILDWPYEIVIDK